MARGRESNEKRASALMANLRDDAKTRGLHMLTNAPEKRKQANARQLACAHMVQSTAEVPMSEPVIGHMWHDDATTPRACERMLEAGNR